MNMNLDGTGSRPPIWPFVAWTAVGAGACFALLSVLSIGVYVAIPVLAATVVLSRWRRGNGVAMFGAVSGVALVLLYVAYLNRGGPGQVCTTTASSQTCTTEWSPWPWLGAGIALFAFGIAAFALLRSRRSAARHG
jgi:hypothetical protein